MIGVVMWSGDPVRWALALWTAHLFGTFGFACVPRTARGKHTRSAVAA